LYFYSLSAKRDELEAHGIVGITEGNSDKTQNKKPRKNPCRQKKRKNQPFDSANEHLLCENKTQSTTTRPASRRRNLSLDYNVPDTDEITKNSEEDTISKAEVLKRSERSAASKQETHAQTSGNANIRIHRMEESTRDSLRGRKHGKQHRSTTTTQPLSSPSLSQDVGDISRTPREETPSWLCRMESRWERMPPGTFPAYVQTGSCQGQTHCMLGLYECTPRRYNIKVLRRVPDRCFPVPTTSAGSEDTMKGGKTAMGHGDTVSRVVEDGNVNSTGSLAWTVGWEQAWRLENQAVIVGCECSRRRRTGSYTPAASGTVLETEQTHEQSDSYGTADSFISGITGT